VENVKRHGIRETEKQNTEEQKESNVVHVAVKMQ